MVEIAAGCRAFEEDLSAWIDGELGASRRAVVAAHLATCGDCAERVEQLRAVDRALRALPAPSVGPELRRGLAERLASEERSAARPKLRTPPRARRRLAPLVALPAAAAAALALYLSLRPAGAPVGRGPDLPLAGGRAAQPPGNGPAAARAPVAEVPAEAAVAETREAGPPGSGDLEALESEELAVVLELDTIEDLPVIANLEVLERLLAAEAG